MTSVSEPKASLWARDVSKSKRNRGPAGERAPPSLQRQPSMPGNEQNISISSQMLAQFAAHHGPLPSPETFAAYNDALPGAAERIMAMAEREQAHRHLMETEALSCSIEDQEAQRAERRRGQYLAFGIGVTALIGSTVASAFGASFAGGAVGIAAIASLVSVFILGNRAKQPPQIQPPETKQSPPGTSVKTS